MENPQKSSHCTPDEGCHGLVLPNPSRCAFIGGVSSGKTNALLCTLGHCHAWTSFVKMAAPRPTRGPSCTRSRHELARALLLVLDGAHGLRHPGDVLLPAKSIQVTFFC